MKTHAWKNWSIGTRLILLTTLPLIILFCAVVWYSYYSRLAEVQEELAEHGQVVATSLAESSEYGIISNNLADVRHVLDALIQSDASIYRIDILDANRHDAIHVISHLTTSLDNRVFEAPVRKKLVSVDAFAEDGAPHVSGASDAVPLVSPPEIVGYVRLSMSPSHILEKQNRRFKVLLIMALSALLGSSLLAFLLSRTLSWPVAKSIGALRQIRGGNYLVQIKVCSGGEIGELQSSINEMSIVLNQSKQNLENKVLARTRDLEASRNEALKADAEKRKLIQKVNSLIEDERKSIAIEIHDELNATLIGARLESQGILDIANDIANESETNAPIEDIKSKAQSIINLTARLYASGRNIVRRLRPEVLDTLGLHGAVEEMLQNYDLIHPTCTFTFQSEGDFSTLESAFAITAYRLTQEALSNVVKHSGASKASVSLFLDENEKLLRIFVSDNGNGFDSDNTNPGIGIIGMRERVYSLNGEIDILSSVNGGTEISVRLPLSQETPSNHEESEFWRIREERRKDNGING